MRTIFITSYHSLIARNILYTDVLSILKNNNIRIVVLVHPQKTDYFRKIFLDENVEVVGVNPKHAGLDNFIYFISVCLISVENLFVRGLLKEGRHARFFFGHLIFQLFHRFFIIKKMLRFFSNKFMVGNEFADLFLKYNPSVIFSTDVYGPFDRKLVSQANREAILTIGMVRSWDNPTTKGVLLAVPDKIVVPNKALQEDLWQYNRIKSENIFISGIPHYDSYLKTPRISREDFFRKMGLDPSKKLILFAPAGALLYEHDGGILKSLQELNDFGKLCSPVQFLVRFHPGSKSNLSGFVKSDNFSFDEPGLDLIGVKKQRELTDDDNARLHAALCYSDIVMTVVSTIAIDGAVFNKPTIIVSFNPEGASDDIKKFMRDFHFKKFVSLGCCKVANSESELATQINEYLTNPALDSEKRKRITEKYCYKLDGQSSERLAEFVLDSINNESKN
jgi:hypothetical protein